jgi:predicted NBD/HSP70 family sugar kinase
MDGDELREAVESAKQSQLDRLGSSKLLVALTDATLSTAAVLDVAAHSEHAARETFRAWAEAEGDEEAREAFAAVADQEDEHLDRVLAAMDDPDAFAPSAEPGPMHGYLRGREETVDRIAGGMVGRPLVSLRTHTQIVSFFVNEADETRADLFRDLGDETAAVLADGLDLLEARCGSDDDWDRARAVAEYTVQTAYDDYADTLRGMGVEPKSIC